MMTHTSPSCIEHGQLVEVRVVVRDFEPVERRTREDQQVGQGNREARCPAAIPGFFGPAAMGEQRRESLRTTISGGRSSRGTWTVRLRRDRSRLGGDSRIATQCGRSTAWSRYLPATW